MKHKQELDNILNGVISNDPAKPVLDKIYNMESLCELKGIFFYALICFINGREREKNVSIDWDKGLYTIYGEPCIDVLIFNGIGKESTRQPWWFDESNQQFEPIEGGEGWNGKFPYKDMLKKENHIYCQESNFK